MQLIEEAVDGGWIGHRARAPGSEIGSVYSPPSNSDYEKSRSAFVETVVDIGLRERVSIFSFPASSSINHLNRDG